MKRTKTIRLAFWLPVSVFSSFTFLLLYFSYLQYQDVKHDIEQTSIITLKERLSRVSTRIERLFDKNLENEIGQEIAELDISSGSQAVALLDKNCTVVTGSVLEWNGQNARRCIPHFDIVFFRLAQSHNELKILLSDNRDHLLAYSPVVFGGKKNEIRSMDIGMLFYTYDLKGLKDLEKTAVINRTANVWITGLVLMLFLFLLFRYRLVFPFRHLLSGVDSFGKGNYNSRIEISGKGELSDLGKAFNKMADEVVRQRSDLEQVIISKTMIQNELIVAKQKAEESDKLKSAFLANMSHEIRTPMNGILGFSELLKEKNLSEQEKEKYIAIIHKGSHQLLDIINDLIDISKIEAGQVQVNVTDFLLSDLLKDIEIFFRPIAEKKGLQLNLDNKVAERHSWVSLDQVKIRQVLVNLIGNAIKFTDEGGIEFGCRFDGLQFRFHVSDTGIGIDSSHFSSIFDRFRQVEIVPSGKFGGTGLGLAITRSYVEMMGGSIHVKSEPGKGSRFIFTIPYAPAEKNPGTPLQEESPMENPDYGWFGKKILMVEDIEDNAVLIQQLLKSTGLEIIRAETGNDALLKLSAYSDFSMILMDMKLPDLDGYEVTRRLREMNIRIPVIAITAYAMSGDRERCLQAGCNDYLPKPLKKKDLLQKIDNLLKHH